MTPARTLALLLLSIGACACGSTEEPLAPSTGERAIRSSAAPLNPVRFSGRVLDWSSGAGVPATSVELGGVHVVTDADGRYTMTLPVPGAYDPIVAGLSVGASHVFGASYRGDFLANSGTCVSRYGTIVSARTALPIDGAAVALGAARTTTGADGWYRIDLGCPANGQGFNPTSFTVTKPGYAQWTELETRGVFLAVRIDVQLVPDQRN